MNDDVAKARAILAETRQFLRDDHTRAMRQYLESLSSGPIRSVSAGLASSGAKILMIVQCGTKRQRQRPCTNLIAAVAWTPAGLAWIGAGVRPLDAERISGLDPRDERNKNRDVVEPLIGPWDEPLRAYCWVQANDDGRGGSHKSKWFTIDRARALELSRKGSYENPAKVTIQQLEGR